MSRFDQRLKQRLQNPEFAAGYWEMDGELQPPRSESKTGDL